MATKWDKHDIRCNRCGKYLFTEYDRINPVGLTGNYRRENDKENYIYDEIADEFICHECEDWRRNEHLKNYFPGIDGDRRGGKPDS